MTGHLEKHHAEEWGAYCEVRKRTKAEVAAVKKEEVESCEMENSEVRFYVVRSSKGCLPFLAIGKFWKGIFHVLILFLCRCCLTYLNPLSTALG